jgi:TolA-binding protein
MAGCFWVTTRRQGEELSQRIEVLEKQLQSDRQEYTDLIRKAETDVAALEKVLERATHAAGEYAADTQGMREELSRLEGGLAELREELSRSITATEQQRDALRARVEAVASKVGLDPPVDQAQIPADKARHLAAAKAAYDRSAYGEARSLYRAYAERYPTDDKVDDAQLEVGRSYAKEGRHAQALTAFNVIVDRYPDSDVMGQALVEMAGSLYQMRSCNDAATLLQSVIDRYRDRDLVERARSKLREVQQAKRRGCRP